MKNFLFIFFLLPFCTHAPVEQLSLDKKEKLELYSLLEKEIKAQKASELKECNCMKAFYRNLFDAPNGSARYAFDQKVGENALFLSEGKKTVDVLALGSGTLLNELTAISNILARGKNLNLYLSDYSYIFYGEEGYEKKALLWGENPDLIPEGWRNFFFWPWHKNKRKPYLPHFKKNHTAINKFKKIVAQLDKFYGTKTKITILKPPSEKAEPLPSLDIIIAIDAFLDLPNIIWNLFYKLPSNDKPVRFMALNKTKPHGGFWNSEDFSKTEIYSLEPVSLSVYDIKGDSNSGSYKLVEKITFKPNEKQLKKAPEFIKDPKREPAQSPLDLK